MAHAKRWFIKTARCKSYTKTRGPKGPQIGERLSTTKEQILCACATKIAAGVVVLWALLMLGVLTVLEIPDHNYANSRVVEVCPAHLCSEIVQDMADREPDQALEQSEQGVTKIFKQMVIED